MRSRGVRSAPPGTVQAHGIRQWWLDQSVRTKGLIVVAVPMIALMGLTSADLLLQRDESNERNISLTARNLDDAAYRVLADTVNGETGIRGYAATRDPLFLAPYTLMLTRFGAERRSLRAAAVREGDGGQQRAVDATAGQELVELAQLRSAISDGTSTGNLRPALETGKTTMDLLRRQVASLAAGPAALVAVKNEKISTLRTRTELLDIVGLVLGLLAGLAGAALFTSDVASRIGVNAENARRLGEGLPLAPILFAGDEIGRVAQSHLRAEALLARRAKDLMAARDAAMKPPRPRTRSCPARATSCEPR
jgi:CHASE3 domain sensor protein